MRVSGDKNVHETENWGTDSSPKWTKMYKINRVDKFYMCAQI